jgi:hypothetical protein
MQPDDLDRSSLTKELDRRWKSAYRIRLRLPTLRTPRRVGQPVLLRLKGWASPPSVSPLLCHPERSRRTPRLAGGPPLTIFARHPHRGVPHPCVFCKGGRRCCVCHLILLWTRDQTHLAPAFPIPALRQERKGRGTHCLGNARKIKSLGHPPKLLNIIHIPVTGMQAKIMQDAIADSQQNPPPYSLGDEAGRNCDCASWAQQILDDAGINSGMSTPWPDVLMRNLQAVQDQQ